MKVLWFSHIPIHPIQNNTPYKGGNWITSLKEIVLEGRKFELAVCYHSTLESEFKIIADDGTTHYNLCHKPTALRKIYDKVNHKLNNDETEKYIRVIRDYQPDVIQIFGTESGFGRISSLIDIPVIIHVQGLLNPCLMSWLPPGINLFNVFKTSRVRALLLGNGLFHRFFYLRKQAAREIIIIKQNQFYFTRTNWDRSFINLINPEAEIFHCDEVIRPEFSADQWTFPTSKKIKLVSVINGEIYKGWDNILRIANVLTNYTDLDFEWHVIGVEDTRPEKLLFENKYKLKFNANNVFFAGKKDAGEIIQELKTSHFFMHVSHVDNSPNSVCEAMTLGLPVMCTDIGGCPSLITDYQSGFLLPDNDPFLWAHTLIDLLNDIPLLNSVSKEARQIALKRHNIYTIYETLVFTYQRIIGNKHSSQQISFKNANSTSN